MAKATNKPEDDTPSEAPQVVPSIGLGHPNFNFFQFSLEVQKSLGEINASLTTLHKSVESTKTKVDDLVNWKNKILGGAIVAGAICTLIAFGLSKLSEYVTLKPPAAEQTAQAVPAATQTPLPLAPVSQKKHHNQS